VFVQAVQTVQLLVQVSSSTTITTPANIVAVSYSSISQCPSTLYDNIPLHSIVEDQIPETVSISDKLRS